MFILYYYRLFIAARSLLVDIKSNLLLEYSWLAHAPSLYTLLANAHSWLAHTPDQHTLLVSAYSWLLSIPHSVPCSCTLCQSLLHHGEKPLYSQHTKYFDKHKGAVFSIHFSDCI